MVSIKTGFVLPLCIYGQRAIRDDYNIQVVVVIQCKTSMMKRILCVFHVMGSKCSIYETLWQSEHGEAVNSG